METYSNNKWEYFKKELPHHRLPYSKKNWGNRNHSLCSYQGKLKPAIAYHLIKAFVPEGGRMFDPFAGVGTLPFEAALNGITAYGMDISQLAYYVTSAKIGVAAYKESADYIDRLKDYISSHEVPQQELDEYSNFGLNRKLGEYYEKKTFKEILLARTFIRDHKPGNASECVVVASLLHILHGNRPYALSRRSHPIVPYAPSGEYVYKNLVEKLCEKVNRFYAQPYPRRFKEGKMFLQDSTKKWPDEINELDSVITSPPFYDSTRFYVANWIRLWFCGWEPNDFVVNPQQYVDERQKKTFYVYRPILEQAKERLKQGGTFVFHLGKSRKCDMGKTLMAISKPWFTHAELFTEDVNHCAKFGIKDLGTVTEHEYLVLW